jgi:hypothetical protein
VKDTYSGNLSIANIPSYSSYYMALKEHNLKTRVIKLVVVIFVAGITAINFMQNIIQYPSLKIRCIYR